MTIYAPAKVNLFLKVLGRRKDGYHEIETIFERIALSDKIVLRPFKKDKIKIFSDHPDVPVEKKGLIYRTINLLKTKHGISSGVEVKIFKRIPVASGLGGGSSDAAGVLIALNKLWKLSLDSPHLAEYGKGLGSDIPFFLSGKTFAMAEGRGDEVMPLEWKIKLWHLIISMPVKLLSKEIYRTYAMIKKLPRKAANVETSKKFLFKVIEFEDVKNFIVNDLEESIFEKAPVVASFKNALKNIGITHSLVSGSGPSIFSLFKRRKEAVEAKELLVRHFPIVKNKGWQIFIVPTL